MLPKLPRHSRYFASVLDDAESAAELMAAGDGGSSFGWVGWTHERELLSTLIDAVRDMHATLIQVHSGGKDRPTMPLMRRPTTALDRVEARQLRVEHEQRVSMWLPGRSD